LIAWSTSSCTVMSGGLHARRATLLGSFRLKSRGLVKSGGHKARRSLKAFSLCR
jgi:hypothetical protein